MPIIIYAILEASPVNQTIAHILELLSVKSGIQFELLSTNVLTAIISAQTGVTSAICQEEVLRYAAIIDAIAQQYSILPMRYGSVAASSGDVKTLLEKNSESFVKVLKKVMNKEEYSLRLMFSRQQQDAQANEESVAVTQSLPGALQGNTENKRYLLNKYRQHIIEENRIKYIEHIQSMLIHDLKKITEFVEFNKKVTPAFIVDAVLLVDRSAKGELLAFVAHLQSIYPEHNVMLTGPWAPYNFAQIKLE